MNHSCLTSISKVSTPYSIKNHCFFFLFKFTRVSMTIFPTLEIPLSSCCYLEAWDAGTALEPAASDQYVKHSPSHCQLSENCLEDEESLVCRSTTGVMQRSNENAPFPLQELQTLVKEKNKTKTIIINRKHRTEYQGVYVPDLVPWAHRTFQA